jgi:hypothetical protein
MVDCHAKEYIFVWPLDSFNSFVPLLRFLAVTKSCISSDYPTSAIHATCPLHYGLLLLTLSFTASTISEFSSFDIEYYLIVF